MTDSDPIQQRLSVAIDAARRAGTGTLEHFCDASLNVETKSDGSVVTIADRAAESMLREIIRDSFPDDAVLGEEHDDLPGDSGYRWILDPIDGTRSFVQGVPLYGTLVAVERMDERESVVGVVYMPGLDEMVYAASGSGAWHQFGSNTPVRAQVSDVRSVDESLLCITALDYFTEAGLDDVCLDLLKRFGVTRGWSDCYAHVLVATGRAEAVIEPVINVWDVAPMPVIMAEAGGRYSDWHGTVCAHQPTAVATNGHIHDEIVAHLSTIAASFSGK